MTRERVKNVHWHETAHGKDSFLKSAFEEYSWSVKSLCTSGANRSVQLYWTSALTILTVQLAELYEYKATGETMWNREDSETSGTTHHVCTDSLVAKEIRFLKNKMLKKKRSTSAHVTVMLSEPPGSSTGTGLMPEKKTKSPGKRISISKIVSECKKRDDQLSRREISRNYLYRTSHQETCSMLSAPILHVFFYHHHHLEHQPEHHRLIGYVWTCECFLQVK